MHATLGPQGNENRLFALAELSFLHAERTGSRARYFATVVYAYAFLAPEGAGSEPRALDPRTRDAADLYNLALTEAFQRGNGLEVVLLEHLEGS